MSKVSHVYAVLRRKNIRNYTLLLVCNFISVLLITAFGVMMQSNTVQTILPDGGDSRKQMTMIFTLAIVGCMLFTSYASSLFFRAKSRETGIFMALGTKRRQLSHLLFGDLALIALVSSAAGILLGLPLALGIWQLFRLFVVDSAEMNFSPNASGFVWPLAFAALTTVVLFCMGWRFIRRSNIIDIVNEQRKSEPVRDVKRWFGLVGILLMVVGIVGAVGLPNVMASMGYTPPPWASLLYLLAAAGLYMLLLSVVVRGLGGRKTYYKNIISRSMMKFQGRQTVLNMCVIAVLIMAAYYSTFYITTMASSTGRSFAARPLDNAFHHRIDEPGIPTQSDIEQMAQEEGVTLLDYATFDFVNMATDGYDREWTDDGRYGNTYIPFYQEESFLPESAFSAATGMNVSVEPGRFLMVIPTGYSQSPYDYYEDMQRFTNPTTLQELAVTYQGSVEYDLMPMYILLDDADYAALTQGLDDSWKEQWVQFNVADVDASYPFARRLKNAIIDGCTEKSASFRGYDRVEKINADAAGESYFGDTVPQMQVDYAERDSSNFNESWRYIPMFRVLDKTDFLMNFAVYLMLFAFMAIICFAAVIVIAYTRCLTIALNNRQVYDDLRHLGARRDYLYRSVRGQVSRVYLIPLLVGTLAVTGFHALTMYANSGSFDTGELISFGMNIAIIAVVSAVFWCIYRVTLGRTTRILHVEQKPARTA